MYQTRSEESGIEHFSSLEAAFTAARADLTIWKISFGDSPRMRLVRRPDLDNGAGLIWEERALMEEVLENLDQPYSTTMKDQPWSAKPSPEP